MSDVSSATSGSNKLRITGMASGLDVDATVKKMMAGEQVKVDKAQQEQQTIKWRQELYQDIIKDIKELQTSFFDSTNADKNILSSTNFSGFDATGGDTAVANITAGVGSQAGSYKISVGPSGLATKASIAGTKLADGTNISKTLGDLGLTDDTDSFNITYNGTTKTINVKKADKLSDIVNRISSTTSGSVTASFSELTGKFMIQSANTGSSQNVSIAKGSGTGNTLTALMLTEETKSGTDATVTITPPGGSATTVTKSTNSFTIDGISYNLTGEGTSNVTVSANNDKVYDKVKAFIDKYNTVIDKIQTKLLEKKDSTYKPLTDSQKESMTDDQITGWETKAKKGLLRNDQNLQNMLSGLKSAFTTGVSGVGLTIGKYGTNSIGLDTSTDYSKPGHIDITDASKLKAAISAKGDQILKLFANVSTSTDKTTAYNENGIFARIKNIFQDNVGFTNTTLNAAILTKYANKQDDFSITGSSGSATLPNQIYQKQIAINKLKETLSSKEEGYYQKFSKLESAMNNLNSQQSWLSQQFSG